MDILLFRHGIAEAYSDSGSDGDRRLTPRGIERTASAARGLAALCDTPHALLTSPKVRARQTAEIAGEVFGLEPTVLPVIAEGPAQDIIAVLGKRRDTSVMVVGHEPTLSQMIELLVADRCLLGGFELKKAGAALLDAPLDSAARRGSGCLRWLVPPKALRAMDPRVGVVWTGPKR